jgi:ubiquitin-conjugating enzyme E2 variant
MTSTSTTAPTQQPKKGRSKFVIDENENLKSTTEHRLWTYGCMALMAGTFAQGINHVQGPEDALGVAAALAAAYVLSDLGTGIYHWFVDNYGDGNTPVFGRQIAAFQVRQDL